jgi:hypothetical protein
VTGVTLAGGLVGAGAGALIASAVRGEGGRCISGLAAAGIAGGYALGMKLGSDMSEGASGGTGQLRLDFAAIGASAVSYAAAQRFAAPNLVSLRF